MPLPSNYNWSVKPPQMKRHFCSPSVILLLFSLFTFHVSLSFGQCCSPGNPIGGTTALGVNEEGVWKFFLNYRYGYSGQYFEGNQASTTQFIQDGNYNHLGLIAMLGLTDRLTVEAEAGYFFNKTQRYVPGILPTHQSGRGLTDLTFTARFNFFRDLTRDWEVTGGLGFKVPLGNHQLLDQGIVLPRDLQPTTGAYDLVQTFFLYKGFLPQKIRTFLLTRLELKGQSIDEYQYGNFFATSLFGTYSLGTDWVLIAQLRGEFRGRDSRPFTGTGINVENDREEVIPTGSQKLFFVPQISYLLSPQWQVSVLGELPVYQQYNDRQLGNTAVVMLSLGYTLEKQGLSLPK